MDNNTNLDNTKKNIFGSKYSEWLIYKLPASFFWLWFTYRFFNIPFLGQDISKEYLLFYPGLAWLYLIISRKWIKSIIYPFYIIVATPLGIVLILLKTIMNLWKGSVKIFRIAKSTQLVILLLILTLLGWIVVLTIDDVLIQAWAALIAHTSFYLLFLQSFRWASNPFNPFFKAIDFIWNIAERYLSYGIETHYEAMSKYNEGTKYLIEFMNKGFDYLLPPKKSSKKGISEFIKNNLIFLAISCFVILYIGLAVSFSVTILKIDKVWGPIFQGFSASPTFIDYFYFSFTTQATAMPDTIQPVSVLGKFLIIWLVITGILLFSALLVLFTTSIGFQGDQAISDLENYLTRKKDRLENWETKLSEKISAEVEIIDANLIEKTLNNDEDPF